MKYAVLTDITPNRATVAVCGTNHTDLFNALEQGEQRRLVRAGAGWAVGQRVRTDSGDFIADPGAVLEWGGNACDRCDRSCGEDRLCEECSGDYYG